MVLNLTLSAALWVSVGAVETQSETCIATIFAQPGDKHAGGRSPWLRRRVRPTDLGVAHRTHPLGSWVKVTNLRTGKSVRVRVIDRGPYGKLDARGRWFNGARHPRRRGRFRGCVDLTPATARRIDHNGFERVRVVVSSNPARLALGESHVSSGCEGKQEKRYARRAALRHRVAVVQEAPPVQRGLLLRAVQQVARSRQMDGREDTQGQTSRAWQPTGHASVLLRL
jgi:hypothetical protein